MKRSTLARCVVVLSFYLGACAANESDTEDAPARMTRQDSCARTQCEQDVSDCVRRSSSNYRACLENCVRSGSASCFNGCNSITSASCNLPCSPTSPCVETSVRFVAPRRDDAVAAACGRYASHLASCGSPVNREVCATYARVQVSAMTQTYDCYARQPCGATTNPCELPGVSRGTMSAVEARMSALCGAGSVTPELARFIEMQDRIARPDVIDALLGCGQADRCGVLQTCIDAWLTAVQG